MFTIYWQECHNPLNWGDTEEEGIKKLKANLPTIDIYHDANENDGWVLCVCELKANTLEEAKELAEENCIGNGCDVFSISKDNKVVFTEEDLD